MSLMDASIDLRCDRDPRRLFAKIRTNGEKPPSITEGNLFEVACRDCAKVMREQYTTLKQVFHRFDAAGTLVETEAIDHNGERLFIDYNDV